MRCEERTSISIRRALSSSEPSFRISGCSSRSNKRLAFLLHSAPIEPLKAKSIYDVPGSNQPTTPRQYERTNPPKKFAGSSLIFPNGPEADDPQRRTVTTLLETVSIPSTTISLRFRKRLSEAIVQEKGRSE